MNRARTLAVLLTLALAACVPTNGAVEQNSLGITELQVTRTHDSLGIVGLGADRSQLARVALVLGDFVIEDFGPTAVAGRSLELDVRGQIASHLSKGRAPLDLPLQVRDTDYVAFLSIPSVAAELAAWDVAFHVEAPASPTEAALSSCTFATNASCGRATCWQDGTGQTSEISAPGSYESVCCDGSATAVKRLCSGNSGGTNSCGAVGPLGCAVCWSRPYERYCAIDHASGQIYSYSSNPAYLFCGLEGSPCSSDIECCQGGTWLACVGNQAGQPKCTRL